MKMIVEDFLHTVVIVDDEALPPTSSEKKARRRSEDSKESQPPESHSSAAPGGLAITKLREPDNEEPPGHELPARDASMPSHPEAWCALFSTQTKQ